MTAKTYGQVLKDALTDDPEIGRLLFVPDESFERCARAVILEFVRRVEEREYNTPEPDDYYGNEGFYSHKLLADAFRELSTELKEAK